MNNNLKNGEWSQEKIRQKINDNHLDVNQMNKDVSEINKEIKVLQNQKSVLIIRISKRIKYRNLLIKQLK